VHAAIEVLEGIDATVDLTVAYAAKAQMQATPSVASGTPMPPAAR
jgi:hypothetical protein